MLHADTNFAGIDVFVVQGCDNAAAPLCSTGTMTITVPRMQSTTSH